MTGCLSWPRAPFTGIWGPGNTGTGGLSPAVVCVASKIMNPLAVIFSSTCEEYREREKRNRHERHREQPKDI